MKRYDLMSKEEIIDFNSKDCEDCPLRNKCYPGKCKEEKANYLNEEVNIKRWELIKSTEDIEKLYLEWRHMCEHHFGYNFGCSECSLNNNSTISACFAKYLMEEVTTKV